MEELKPIKVLKKERRQLLINTLLDKKEKGFTNGQLAKIIGISHRTLPNIITAGVNYQISLKKIDQIMNKIKNL